MRSLLVALAGVALVPMLVIALVVIVPARGGQSGTPGVACSPDGVPQRRVAGKSPEQLDVAAQIVAAGQEMGAPQEAWVIAVATAVVESDLRTLPYGDDAGPDSRGPFQQRDSWGPVEVRMDPKGSARLFYERLLALDPPWYTTPLSLTNKMNPAQRVQISAFPQKYAEKEQQAREIVGAVLGITCTAPAHGGANRQHPRAQEVVNRALAQQGVPYAWGGGDRFGPTRGVRDGGVADAHGDFAKVGFDCSGLVTYAWAGAGVEIPSQTKAIWLQLQRNQVAKEDLLPGDLILLSLDGSPNGIHHVGIYVGGDAVVEAPQSGMSVRVLHDIWTSQSGGSSWYATEFFAAVRPGVPAMPSADRR